MPDELEHYFRCMLIADQFEFQVGVVEWHGPYTPGTSWKTFRTWKTKPDPERLAQARSSALKVPRFFRTCIRCGELTNAGYMHDSQTCQGCAERYLGVEH